MKPGLGANRASGWRNCRCLMFAIPSHDPIPSRLELLHSRGCPMANNGIDLAAEAGRREAVVWLLDNGYRPDSGVIDPGYGDEPQATPEEGAARGGHEAFMQELLARRSGPAASGWPLASRGLLLGWLAIQ